MSTHLFLNCKNEKLWSLGVHQRNGGKSLYQEIKKAKLSSFSFSPQPLCIIFIYIAKTRQNMTHNRKVLNPEFQRLHTSMFSTSQVEICSLSHPVSGNYWYTWVLLSLQTHCLKFCFFLHLFFFIYNLSLPMSPEDTCNIQSLII